MNDVSNSLFLGQMTVKQFLTEYWQKKPYVFKNALPALANLFEPQDMFDLAQMDGVTARILQQKPVPIGSKKKAWTLKNSPFTEADLNNNPALWTLLVQAVDHYSPELNELWNEFNCLPQWRRDDVMVSYAPQGGSVGHHFDYYDVFLCQVYGQRRWQLGQMCDQNTPMVVGEPIKLLASMGDITFDEVMNPGDVLYIPPGMAHYGVAQSDCLTASFGFRMPNAAELLDRTVESIFALSQASIPLKDIARSEAQAKGLVSSNEIAFLRQQVMQLLQDDHAFTNAAMSVISEAKFPDGLPDFSELDIDEWEAILRTEDALFLEPAQRLLYTVTPCGIDFWCNGEQVHASPKAMKCLQQLVDHNCVDTALLLELDIAESYQLCLLGVFYLPEE